MPERARIQFTESPGKVTETKKPMGMRSYLYSVRSERELRNVETPQKWCTASK